MAPARIWAEFASGRPRLVITATAPASSPARRAASAASRASSSASVTTKARAPGLATRVPMLEPGST
ncbi:MAG: hypothetical protein AB7D57_03825 [Desulfovibrionaceae bacterium]